MTNQPSDTGGKDVIDNSRPRYEPERCIVFKDSIDLSRSCIKNGIANTKSLIFQLNRRDDGHIESANDMPTGTWKQTREYHVLLNQYLQDINSMERALRLLSKEPVGGENL